VFILWNFYYALILAAVTSASNDECFLGGIRRAVREIISSKATLVRNALVRNALVRNAFVRNGLVRNALVRNAFVRNGLVRNGSVRKRSATL